MVKVEWPVDIEALLSTMPLEEKLGQLTMLRIGAGEDMPSEVIGEIRAGRAGSVLDLKDRAAIEAVQNVARTEFRLGIPLIFGLDVLHGYKTIFPVPLAEAAAMEPELWHATAEAAAVEASRDGISLTFAPMVDVSRDPRWGRMVEGPGEDPWLASLFAASKVRGFQEASDIRFAATAKHYAGYGAVTAGREYNSVDCSERSLHEIHLPPFLAAVKAGVAAIMPSYCDLAGVPMTANQGLLRGILRERWGFDGVIISDFGAVAELVNHGVAEDIPEAAALALLAGVDIDMASGAYLAGLPAALARGLVPEKDIDDAVRRVLRLKLRLGLFAPSAAKPLAEYKHPSHRALARVAAQKSIVLLKNSGSLLPLRQERLHIVAGGPFAGAAQDMLGPWAAAATAEDAITLVEGLRRARPDWKITQFSGAEGITREADVFLLCLGEPASMAGEAASRANLDLDEAQYTLFRRAREFGKPIIAVLTSARPLICNEILERADAVLAAWFLGSEAGAALADILTGAVSPTGKLPVTWPRAMGQIPIFYAQRPTGRPADPVIHETGKYIDMPVTPYFPFGHGLSFTEFTYANLRARLDKAADDFRITIEVDITNSGAFEGEETCFLFIRDCVASVARPVIELRGIAKLRLAPGSTATASFGLSEADLAFPGADGTPQLESGRFRIYAGPCADKDKLLSTQIFVHHGNGITRFFEEEDLNGGPSFRAL